MASALQAKKRKEADENLKQAEKYLTKTMLRWNPDYLAAAPHLEKAADAYRAAGDLDTAKRVFTQAAGVQIKNKSSFRAAQNYEHVAKIAVQQIRDARASGADKLALLREVERAYDAASGHYGDMGELGKAADALLKAAAACEDNGASDISALSALYTRACSLMEAQDKPHFAVEPFRKTLSFLVKHERLSDARAVLGRLVTIFQQIDQPQNVYKLYLSELILLLANGGDVAAADQAYMRQLQDDAYLKSDECALADDLVRAYKLGNEELLQTTIRKQGMSFLDNQIARLARKLTLYGGSSASAPASRPVSQPQRQPQQPPAPVKAAPPTNPFAPVAAPPAPPVPTPVPVQVAAPVAAAAAVVAAAAVAPPTGTAPSELDAMDDDYDFDDTMARATIAVPGDMRGPSSFDFDSLEFAMPSEYEATETESASLASDAPAPVARTVAPAPSDDDIFDLT